MAYQASHGVLAYRIQELDLRAIRAKQEAARLRNASANGDTLRDDYVRLVMMLTTFVDYADESATIPGIGDAILASKPLASGDQVAEAIAARNAAVLLRDWIVSQVQAVNLYSFTTGQTSDFRTNADAFTSTIG